MRRPTLMLAALALAAVAAGCSAANHNGATASPSANDQALGLSIGREYAQCARQHGRPNFPDPAIQDGQLAFPGVTKEDHIAVEGACAPILQRVPVSLQPHRRLPTAEEMAKLRQFSACMRSHGIPDWPDPASDGTFPMQGTPLGAEGKSPRILAARQYCDKYFDGGIGVS